ncbi:hypothetical protein G5T42_13460 [Microbacterium sp. 4R-513]|uniref:hypothetical protein n=1 Tax=Microbacterium sp. 4R-513 TaxID=2567934 RepID=UPI0013E1FE2B|nr:hypothetical protein [Microbacterium sp. 4R-513]QIG40357.1 hypothetical protein G5T42_13460 [Microbacterium sp. 4R-513]
MTRPDRGEDGHRDLDAGGDRIHAITSGARLRAPGEQKIGEDVDAELLQRAVVEDHAVDLAVGHGPERGGCGEGADLVRFLSSAMGAAGEERRHERGGGRFVARALLGGIRS